MSIDSELSSSTHKRYTALGWLVSGFLHTGLVVGAALLQQRIQLDLQEPFTWNVAMATPTSHRLVSMASPPSSVSSERPDLSRFSEAEPHSMPAPPVPATSTKPVLDSPPHPASGEPDRAHEPARKTTPPVEPSELHPSVLSSPTAPVSSGHDSTPTSSQGETETAPAPTLPGIQSPASETARVPGQEGALPTTSEGATAPPSPVTPESKLKTALLHSAGQPKPARADYGWLSKLMATWIENLDKRYPASLRTDGVQGKVTLTALLHDDGRLTDVRVVKSSGSPLLDEIAMDDVRKGPPVTLSRPLERRHMSIKFSITYDLKTAR